MSFNNNFRSVKGAAFMAMALAAGSTMAQQGGLAPTGGGVDFGQIFKNLTNGLGSFGVLMEAVLYITGTVFAVIMLFKLYKWNKSDGRDATLSGILVCFVVAVLGFTMPMLISSGTVQMWGTGNVRTVAPPPSFR